MGNMNEDGKPKITIMGIIIIFALVVLCVVWGIAVIHTISMMV